MKLIFPYERAHENRISGRDQSVLLTRRRFFRAAFKSFLLLQLLFLGLLAYIFGSIYRSNEHMHKIKILFVDYDADSIGTSFREAYEILKSDTFPTLIEKQPSVYPSAEVKVAVCRGHYWGALYTVAESSARLQAALVGGTTARAYNRSNVIDYVFNEARYSAVSDSAVTNSIQKLSTAALQAYISRNGIDSLQILNLTDPSAVAVFSDPWQPIALNIQPTPQGARLVYNTLVVILVMIQEFFYLGTVNGLYTKFKIYGRLWPHRIIVYRNLISLLYTFIGSLCATGMIWAFRDGWSVSGKQFVLTWMVLWLFGHVNFLSLDVFTVWLPPAFIPMALITWMMLNVGSILVPFELMPAFYRWAYVMPAHELYQVLIDIWSRGCNPQLHVALPVLFALELSGLLLTALGIHRRCHYAVVAEEKEKDAFRKRLNEAMAYERERTRTEEEDSAQVTESPHVAIKSQDRSDEKDRQALSAELQRNDEEAQEEDTKLSKAHTLGLAFDLL